MRPWARSSTRSAPFGGEGEAVVGGLAVDEEARAARVAVGDLRTGGVALLADDEEQAHLHARVAQALGRGDLRGDDAFGVAGAAAVEELVVLGAGKNGGTVSMWVERTTSGLTPGIAA
jgi:hypothetical protein